MADRQQPSTGILGFFIRIVKRVVFLLVAYILADYLLDTYLYPKATEHPVEAHIPVGFEFTRFEVESADGYTLSVYQVTHKQNLNKSFPPVIIQHGYGGSGYSWYIHSTEQSVPLVLAELGYTVQVLNGRGTTASLKHNKLNYSLPEYWNFSLEDLSLDVLALLDYNQAAGFKKSVYIGHSQGASQMLAGLGDSRFKEQLEKKIAFSVILTPVWCFKDQKSVALSFLSKLTQSDKLVIDKLGFTRFGILFASENPIQLVKEKLYNLLCSLHPKVCFWAFSGTDHSNNFNDLSNYGTWTRHHPASVPIKGAYHFAQFVRDSADGTCNMGRYDYGTEENLRIYGTERSPRYNLSDIRHPVNIYFGDQDKYYGPEDINRLRNLFKDNKNVKILDHYKGWGHMSFTQGTKTREFYTKDIHHDIQAALRSASNS